MTIPSYRVTHYGYSFLKILYRYVMLAYFHFSWLHIFSQFVDSDFIHSNWKDLNMYSQKTSLRPEIFQWSLASMKNTITKYHVLCKLFQFLCSFIKYEIKLWPICEVNIHIHIISSRKNLKGQKSLCKAMKMKLYWFPMKSSKEKKGKKGGLLNVCLIK